MQLKQRTIKPPEREDESQEFVHFSMPHITVGPEYEEINLPAQAKCAEHLGF